MATWTLDQTIGPDRLLIDLDGDAGGVTSVATGFALDGEWTNEVDEFSVAPSGDNNPGGDFEDQFDVLPGDVNDNLIPPLGFSDFVIIDDVLLVRKAQFQNPRGAGYNDRFNLDDEGVVAVHVGLFRSPRRKTGELDGRGRPSLGTVGRGGYDEIRGRRRRRSLLEPR